MAPIEPAYLMAAGIFLIGLEIVLYSFFIVWIGIGLILVGVLSYVVHFGDGYYQLAIAFSVGLFLLFWLRGWAMRIIEKSEDDSEEPIHRSGVGIVDNGIIKMDGTFWQTDDDLSGYKDGDRVEVVDIRHNRAVLATDMPRQ